MRFLYIVSEDDEELDNNTGRFVYNNFCLFRRGSGLLTCQSCKDRMKQRIRFRLINIGYDSISL